MLWPTQSSLPPRLSVNQSIIVNASGRAEKDIFILAKHLADERFTDFLKDYIAEK